MLRQIALLAHQRAASTSLMAGGRRAALSSAAATGDNQTAGADASAVEVQTSADDAKNTIVSEAEEELKRNRVPEYVKPWQKRWFPNERIILVKPEELDVTCTELVFRVPPHMTKHEIKDYLMAVYGFDVESVNTVNRMGKVKYPAGYSLVKHKAYRRPDFKQAYVTLRSPDLVQQPSNQIVKIIPAAENATSEKQEQ